MSCLSVFLSLCVCVSVLCFNDQDDTQARFGRLRVVMLRHPSDQHETWVPMQRDRRLPSRRDKSRDDGLRPLAHVFR